MVPSSLPVITQSSFDLSNSKKMENTLKSINSIIESKEMSQKYESGFLCNRPKNKRVKKKNSLEVTI